MMAFKFNNLMSLTKQVCRILATDGNTRLLSVGAVNLSGDMKEPEGIVEPYIPPYQEKIDEPIKLKRARLLYQSRKRGMLENGLILSTFAAKYLQEMTPEALTQYDRLINLPTNDWDIYYWATGVRPTPPEFETPIMDLLKKHVKNDDRQSRICQPALY